MRLNKHEIPVKFEVPGATTRQLKNLGNADGPLAAEYFSLAAGTDIAPLLVGLKDDACQVEHWGYFISGSAFVSYSNGSAEKCSAGDIFHWAPGHSVLVEQDAEVILFSPSTAHEEVLDHMVSVMSGV